MCNPIILNPSAVTTEFTKSNYTLTNCTTLSNVKGNGDPYSDMCYLSTYNGLSQIARGIAEVIVVIWSLIYLGIAVKEATFLPMKIFLQCMVLCPSRVLFLVACLLIQIMVLLRLSCQPEYEDEVATLAMFLIPLYFLFFCRGIKLTGPFVTMIYRMIATDLLRFGIIYLVFVH